MQILLKITVFLILLCSVSSSILAGDNTHNKISTNYSYALKTQKTKVFVEGIKLDMDYMRRNMRFVDFVNDPAVADVHIIIKSRTSASGGIVYSMMYNNVTFENFSNFTISATSDSSDTFQERRKKIKNSLSMGLMPFVNQTIASKQLQLKFKGEQSKTLPVETNDPWHSWVFRGDVDASLDLEESKKNYNYSFFFKGDKVTEDWRFRNYACRTVKTRKYTKNNEDYTSNNTTNYFSSSVVKSLSSRWSAGMFGSYYNSNYRNTNYSISFKPAIEYNIFPWDISDRKVFTIAYYIGPEWKKYYEETIYGKLDEGLWEQSLRLDLQLVQTWGEIEAGLDASNYMSDWSKNRITFDTDLSVRIVRGLSVKMGFRIENIHDQIYLPKGEVSLEDILLNKVQMPSTFEINANMGLRIQFGSIYNNIVNNRL